MGQQQPGQGGQQKAGPGGQQSVVRRGLTVVKPGFNKPKINPPGQLGGSCLSWHHAHL